LDQVLDRVLGYEVLEVVPEDTGVAGNRPDYTILPNTLYTWLLEAKAYGVMLSDQHALQATTPAYQNKHRWVVLSNGKEWRLYDSNLTGGDVSQRLVLVGDSENPEAMEALFEALHKEVVNSGRIEEVIRKWLLRQRLAKSLQDPADECVRALCRVLKSQPWLGGLSAGEVAAAMQALLGRAPSPAEDTPSPPADAATEVLSGGNESIDAAPATVEGVPLPDCSKLSREKPQCLVLPDGKTVPVSTWKQLFTELVRYLGESHTLPVPWSSKPTNKTYWLNWESKMADGSPMRGSVTVLYKTKALFVETWASAAQSVCAGVRLCRDLGVDPGTFKVVLR
jgi:hypothetical protein